MTEDSVGLSIVTTMKGADFLKRDVPMAQTLASQVL
jgi:hypothetical protein